MKSSSLAYHLVTGGDITYISQSYEVGLTAMHELLLVMETTDAAANAGTAFSAAVVLAALINKGTDLVKYLRALSFTESRKEAYNSLLTLAVTSVVGVVAVWWFKSTNWADEIKIGDETLQNLSGASVIVFGVVASTVASTVYDVKKALDNTQTAGTPRLFKDAEKKRRARVRNVLGDQEPVHSTAQADAPGQTPDATPGRATAE